MHTFFSNPENLTYEWPDSSGRFSPDDVFGMGRCFLLWIPFTNINGLDSTSFSNSTSTTLQTVQLAKRLTQEQQLHDVRRVQHHFQWPFAIVVSKI
jgi:hypothetical protein